MDVLEKKYGPKSQMYIQLLLEKYNGTKMEETDSMVNHITKMEVMAKDLANVGHPVMIKCKLVFFLVASQILGKM